MLLVEDNSQDADLLRFLIQRSGVDAQITQVMGLREAIAICQRQTFDAVLLDLNLPDSDGQNTAAEFCSLFQDLPVLILSGMLEQQVGIDAIAQGAQDYLAKDNLTPAQLVRAIRYSMHRQATRIDLMRRNDELFEELDRQIQQSRIKFGLISAATHQIKGPLQLIAACLETLQLANVEPDLRLRQTRLGQMGPALTLVFEFLDAIQLTSIAPGNQVSFAPSQLLIEAFCKDIITALTLAIPDSSYVNLQVEELGEKEIRLDPTLLRYILSNLLSNAVKYSPSGENVRLTVSRDESWIKFSVCDRGIGIPLKEQSQVFNPFYRATNARLAQAGSGLGLAIVQTCVELHRGRLELESFLSEGTRVSVFLPLTLSDTGNES